MTNTTSVRPDFVTEEMLDYLDALRESGKTNMFGAASYLVARFGLDKSTAFDVQSYWMETFGSEKR